MYASVLEQAFLSSTKNLNNACTSLWLWSKVSPGDKPHTAMMQSPLFRHHQPPYISVTGVQQAPVYAKRSRAKPPTLEHKREIELKQLGQAEMERAEIQFARLAEPLSLKQQYSMRDSPGCAHGSSVTVDGESSGPTFPQLQGSSTDQLVGWFRGSNTRKGQVRKYMCSCTGYRIVFLLHALCLCKTEHFSRGEQQAQDISILSSQIKYSVFGLAWGGVFDTAFVSRLCASHSATHDKLIAGRTQRSSSISIKPTEV